ncbi:hypothetical protein ACIP69_18215 [Streptomyces hygroscopicus]|uniref:hypothetical protein n=1 Tax=Streptomyces hygroscopicus TaxID=1912 RepID=UPI00380A5AD9
MDYQLTLTIPGQPPAHRTVAGDTPAELAEAVHRHARGILGGQTDVRIDGLAGTIHRGSALAADFILEPAEEPTADAPDTSAPDHVAHGYTLRDIHALTRSACAADRSLSADVTTRYDTAWSAIAEHLCAADTQPGWNELVRVGWQAIYAEVRAVNRMYGVDSTRRSGEVASAPRFAAYWLADRSEPADVGFLERIAVHQILAMLPEHQRQAVVALAVHENYAGAAAALGLKYVTLTARLRFARKTFRDLWFAPDTAPPIKGTDRRVGAYGKALATHCGNGHPWTSENTRWDRGRQAGSARVRRCRACERERSVARRAEKAAA